MLIERKLNTELNLVPNIKGEENAGNYDILISYEFVLDNIDVILNRSYVKLNTLLGSIYSICRLVYYLCRYFNFYISDGLFNYKFSKKISVFKKDKKTRINEIQNLKLFERDAAEKSIPNNSNNNRIINWKGTIELDNFENINLAPETKGDMIVIENRKNENKILNHSKNEFHTKNLKNSDFLLRNKEPHNSPKNLINESPIINTVHLYNSNKLLAKNSFNSESFKNKIYPISSDHHPNKLKKAQTFIKLNNRNLSNATVKNSAEEKRLVNSGIKNKSIESNYDDYNQSKKDSFNIDEKEKVLTIMEEGATNNIPLNKIEDSKINDILDSGKLRKKKLIRKLKTINLDDSNKINLRIGKCFVVFKNLFFCFCQKNKDYRTIAITKEITNHELDIVFITKKLIEYENLKNILIDYEKIELLKYLQKRVFFEKMEIEDISNFYKNIYSVKT